MVFSSSPKFEKFEIIAMMYYRQKQVPKENELELKTRMHLDYSKTYILTSFEKKKYIISLNAHKY